MTSIRFQARARDCSLPHSVQAGSGPHPAPYPIGLRGLYILGVKQQGREADHSLPSSTEVKNDGAMPPLPHMRHAIVVSYIINYMDVSIF
jgi:hypothetical protein